ncbi:MAG: NAD-dependent deacylase, partial [Nitrospiria bacterium]
MDDINQVKQRLASARAITVLTGAGISADSGIPTFRG